MSCIKVTDILPRSHKKAMQPQSFVGEGLTMERCFSSLFFLTVEDNRWRGGECSSRTLLTSAMNLITYCSSQCIGTTSKQTRSGSLSCSQGQHISRRHGVGALRVQKSRERRNNALRVSHRFLGLDLVPNNVWCCVRVGNPQAKYHFLAQPYGYL